MGKIIDSTAVASADIASTALPVVPLGLMTSAFLAKGNSQDKATTSATSAKGAYLGQVPSAALGLYTYRKQLANPKKLYRDHLKRKRVDSKLLQQHSRMKRIPKKTSLMIYRAIKAGALPLLTTYILGSAFGAGAGHYIGETRNEKKREKRA